MRRMSRMGRRVAAPPQAQAQSRLETFPSPVAGWVTNMNLSAAKKGAALVCDNYIPTQTGLKFRGGSTEFFDSEVASPIESLFAYKKVGSKLFAANDESIWNITAVVTEDVTGQTNGHYATVQFETTGGSYMFALNGADYAQRYDGTVWLQITGVSADAITGVATDLLSQGWVWKNRLLFVEGGSMRTWFLPIDSIAGAAADLTLAGVFVLGGSLLFGATWSIDAGDGIDDKCVFVSDQGEVAIYEGSDPADPDLFSLVGRYQLGGRPLGKNAWFRAGGDLIIATLDGLVPLSQCLDKDPAALSLAAISRKIEPDWKREAAARQSLPWDVVKWDAENLVVITNPVVTDDVTLEQCFILNSETGAWGRFTGWNTRCLAVHNDGIYFGTNDGRVMQGNVGGSDDGLIYVCKLALHFDHLGAPGRYKIAKQTRAVFRASRPFIPKMSSSVDYQQSFPTAPSSVANFQIDAWDSGLWDQAVWDAVSTNTVSTTRWVSIVGAGFTHALELQVTFGITPTPDGELMAIDMTYEMGGVVV